MRHKKTKLNAKGRSVNEQFVKLPFWMLACPAYRSLKPGPRALLVEFHGRFNGRNNGRIIFSQRDMAEAIKVSDRQTIAKYVRELEATGFIQAMQRGGFNRKSPTESRATEWALTMYPIGDKPAEKTFMRWQPEKNDGTEKPTGRDGKSSRDGKRAVPPCSDRQENPAVNGHNWSSSRAENPSTYTSIAIGTGV
ncbi:hypothetical protein [Parasphingorhabdus sp.]|uniref:hypothetical protein n=1 Tax=Parasphingorhabdus sp. TaxID=2709688 RepID=UPI003A8D8470